ncbi:hypothetical protein M501DRAFT_985734 [Patellaria atrata CBS 101060]|uniref:Zn(2)-C6 fungal-type domain-containing protein n=1 Tax=Patellaria atrata CBS 101060 TaxID=1346257 RepID=A0A9P4SJX5_9PEZI|nr:hypothetical protein M501DRAFT_985734 [Patellaria atrata CBS 101060]
MSNERESNILAELDRRFKIRVRTGCVTCRIRRIKCDEAKPSCLKCTSTGRVCEGYIDGPLPRKPRSPEPSAVTRPRDGSFRPIVPSTSATLHRPTSQIGFDHPLELRSLDFFRTRTMPSATEFFHSELWSQWVLQLCHSEPAIKHGILAISALHERYEREPSLYSPCDEKDFAFVQYAQAVQHSNQLMMSPESGPSHLSKILIACVLFICYENLAGNYAVAKMHLKNGQRILLNHLQSRKTKDQEQDPLGIFCLILGRLDFQAMTFSDDQSPYEYTELSRPLYPSTAAPPPIPERFEDLQSARDVLVSNLRWIMWTAAAQEKVLENNAQIDLEAVLGTGASDLSRLLALQKQCERNLDDWSSRFSMFMDLHSRTSSRTLVEASSSSSSSLPAQPSIFNPHGATILRMLALTGHTIVRGTLNGTERDWDAQIPTFCQIIDLASTLPRPQFGTALTFDTGPIIPLFLTTIKCRDPQLRRQAIRLLRNSGRREGVWESLAAARVGENVVRIEEEGVRLLSHTPHDSSEMMIWWSAADIEERYRVRIVQTRVVLAEERIRMGCVMRPHWPSGELVVRTEEIKLGKLEEEEEQVADVAVDRIWGRGIVLQEREL